MVRWLCALVTAAVLTGFTFLLLTGQYVNDGPVVARVTSDHGIHAGDVFVVAAWAVAMLGLLVLTLRPHRSS